ncbi:unnamed protein product [Urochloa decumbens]|uniref:Glycosyltransferase n=1 Tax=Urochloa decumbens TaxID=240449 RepID=A0ABC9D8A8_9POAL
MAQGHIPPFRCLVELVRHARTDASITTVAATPSLAKSLRVSLAAEDDVNVARRGFSFHALPFNPAEHGLPAGADTSAKIGSHQLTALFNASESLCPVFCRFVAGLRAVAGPGADIHIMADMFLGWTVDVARDAGVFHSIVLTCGGYGVALYYSLWNSVPLPSDTFTLLHFLEVSVERSQLTDQLATAEGEERNARTFDREEKTETLLVEAILDELQACSRAGYAPLLLLYEARQMMELAVGLEQSAHKFVWVIRPPSGFDVNDEFRPEWLPKGFMEKVEESGQGLVVRWWAPQVEILAHTVTGAFLTHCKWNSVQGSLAHGVPMIGWPLSAEQFYNAKMLVEEMGVCVEVARGGDTVVKEKVAEVVDTVLGQTSVRATMRWKAVELKKVIRAAWEADGDGSSVRVMERFFAAVSRVA